MIPNDLEFLRDNDDFTVEVFRVSDELCKRFNLDFIPSCAERAQMTAHEIKEQLLSKHSNEYLSDVFNFTRATSNLLIDNYKKFLLAN